ncbi:hypothetical protein A2U01_0013373, partial [Trifolium medium]|nr:hypothetical protein [Trifolium medium]
STRPARAGYCCYDEAVRDDENGSSSRDLEKLKSRNEKLEAEVLKLESELIDHQGKQENYVARAKELREMHAALGKAEKELEELRASHSEEKKKLEG